MTEQEKELSSYIYETYNGNMQSLAKAIIQRYPQILAEKVEADNAHVSLDGTKILATLKIPFMKWFNKEFEVFIREVVS